MVKQNFPTWDTVLVPQGAEYQAVKKGLQKAHSALQVLPIPVGFQAVTHTLYQGSLAEQFQQRSPQGIIILGLAGSLSPQLTKGQVVLYRAIQSLSGPQTRLGAWNLETVTDFLSRLNQPITLVNALNSDRVITQAQEKFHLGETYQAQVVDMEGAALSQYGQKNQIPMVMLRVISDDVDQSLPDLSQVYNTQGDLQPWLLAKALFQQPLAGLNLITGSLFALNKLEQLATQLATAIGKAV